MEQPAIEIKHLSKRYDISHMRGGYMALRDILTNVFTHPFRFLKKKAKQATGLAKKEEFWALKDINLEIKRGETIGIIGPNGAGKSTLLKILSQITPPTEGEIILHGKVASMLEVGTGFHPELTGRENIFFNGAVMGMSRAQIARNFDSIVEFSGIGKFIDTPVKYYSSGMTVRLAFSVAAHLEPDILIVDEVLAVGDAEFQKKSLGKMEEITHADNRTILFVSHNMGAIQNLCSRTAVLDHGKVVFFGDTDKAIQHYLERNKEFFSAPVRERTDRKGTGPLRFTDVKIIGPAGTTQIETGKPFKVQLFFEITPGFDKLKNVAMSISLNDQIGGNYLLVCSTETSGSNFTINRNQRYVECEVLWCPVIFGTYSMNIYCTVGGILSDTVKNAAQAIVDDTDYFSRGIRDQEGHPKYVAQHTWRLE